MDFPKSNKNILTNLDGFTTYGKYNISNICLQSLPCQHYVINTETNIEHRLAGTSILKLLDKENIKCSHFEMYRNHPSFTED